MAAASSCRLATTAAALERFEFCRLLGGGDWRAGLRLLLREELAAATAQQQPQLAGKGARQPRGAAGSAQRSAAQRRRAQRRAAVARLLSSVAVAGGVLEACGA